jgi:hypothetical protein
MENNDQPIKPQQNLKIRIHDLYQARVGKLAIAWLLGLSGGGGIAAILFRHGATHPGVWSLGALTGLCVGLFWSLSRKDQTKIENLEKSAIIQQLIRVALQQNGRLTLAEAISELQVTLEEAQEGLERLVQSGACQCRENGGLKFYYFAEFEDQESKRSGAVEQTVVQAAKKYHGKITAAEIISETGLPLAMVHAELDRMIRSNGCQLQVNEQGVLVYSFPEFEREQTVPVEQSVEQS